MIEWSDSKLASLDDAQLKVLIENHERLGKDDAPSYFAAKAEQRRRKAGTLDPEKFLAALIVAAKRQETISYGALVAACDADWNQARFYLNHELAYINDISFGRYDVFLSTICTNAEGGVDSSAVKGFAAYLEDKGISVYDAKVAFTMCRDEAFDKFAP